MVFQLHLADFATILFLVFLEGVLSLDNAIVLALFAGNLPKEQRKKALFYGLVGAVVFRLIAIVSAIKLLHNPWLKIAGGLYLFFLSTSHFRKKRKEKGQNKPKKHWGFWRTIVVIELLDIAFALDSILSAVALSKKLPVVVIGGFLGLLFTRFAASLFLKLLEIFPRFETTAYGLIFLIGMKLFMEGLELPSFNFNSYEGPAFWAFWLSALAVFAFGLTKKTEQ